MRDQTPDEDSWKDPGIISTVEFVRFLKKTLDVGQGKSNLKEGFAELLAYIQGHFLPMKKRTISKGVEEFITHIEEMKDDNPSGFEFSTIEEKELSRAVHNLVSRSRRYDEVLDTAVGNAVHDVMKNDPKNSFSHTMNLLNEGLSSAIQHVVGNHIFDGCDAGSMRYKTKFSSSPSHAQRASYTPENKKARSKSPAAETNKDTPVCNGCGRWISDSHTQDTCEHILKKTEGYNKDWKTVSWADSDACKAVKDKVLQKKPGYQGQFYLFPPRSSTPKDANTKGMISCSTLSTNHPNTLPII